ncbi:MAG: PcfJ domain-containing protein [Eubacteriales bacterium]|nr:PcfJ domain-containing protein [Eubacteriales bacterium]
MLKKKEILPLPVLDIKAHGKEDWVGRIRMLGKTMVLDVYDARRIMCPKGEEKEAEIKFRWACDGKNYVTYLFLPEQWISGGIYYAMHGALGCYCSPRITMDIESTKLAEKYGKKSWNSDRGSDCLYRLEDKIRQEKRDREYDNRQARINERAGKRKPLPKDWDRWLGATVFKTERYLFYDSKDRKHGHCAHCDQNVALDGRQKHNAAGRCPECGSRIQYKAQGKAAVMKNTKQAIYLQSIPEGFLIRYFKVRKISSVDGERYEMEEQEITTYSEKKTYHDFNLAYPWSKNEHWYDSKDASFSAWKEKGYLYTRNAKKALQGTKFQYAPVDIWAKHERREIELERFFEKFEISPFLEYFLKAGLFNLTNDYIKSHETWKGKTPQEILGIDAQKIRELIQADGGMKYLQILRIEQNQGRKMPKEDKRYLESSAIDLKSMGNLTKYASVSRIRNYMEKNDSYSTIAERETHWEDYINMAAALDWDMENDVILFPRDLERRHNEASTLINKQKFQERCEKVDEKYTRIPKLKKSLEKKYGYENEDYTIVIPEKASDFVIEGANLNHCVGRSDVYIENHNNGKSFILFLRKSGREDIAFYTLEIGDNKVVQSYGYGDKKTEWASVKKFLDEYQAEVLDKKRVRVRAQVAASA